MSVLGDLLKLGVHIGLTSMDGGRLAGPGARIEHSSAAFASANFAAGLFIATSPCKLVGMNIRYGVKAAGTCTIQIEKCAATEAAGAGDDLLSAALDGESDALTALTGSLVTTSAATLAAGDVLRLVLASGASTGLADINVGLNIEYI